MFSLNPFHKSPDSADPRCQHLSANGSRCRNPISPDDDQLCRFHSEKLAAAEAKSAREAEAAAVVAELYGQVTELNSEAAVAHVLGNLFRLIAEDRIPAGRAALLNSTARTILRALKDHRIALRQAAANSAKAQRENQESPEENRRRKAAEIKAYFQGFPYPRQTPGQEPATVASNPPTTQSRSAAAAAGPCAPTAPRASTANRPDVSANPNPAKQHAQQNHGAGVNAQPSPVQSSNSKFQSASTEPVILPAHTREHVPSTKRAAEAS